MLVVEFGDKEPNISITRKAKQQTATDREKERETQTDKEHDRHIGKPIDK